MKKYIVFLMLAHLSYNTSAQGVANSSNGPVDPSIESFSKVPQTPNAASLGVYGEVPVGLYSGAAQFSIPLYSVQGKNLSVPVTLNYSTNGLHVEALSSWVGAGWSLDAGGVITRTIKGKIDNPNEPIQKASDGCLIKAEAMQFELGHVDLEYDRYFYNFMGKTGSFVIVDGEIKSIDNQQMKFDYSGTNLNEFVITDTEGIKYYFGTAYSGGAQPIEYAQESNTSVEIKTAWYLAKIVHWGGETIHFTYNGGVFDEPYSTGYFQTRQKYIASDSMCSDCPTSADWSALSSVNSSHYRHKAVYLGQINTSDYTDVVSFIRDSKLLSQMNGKNRKAYFTLSPVGVSHRKYLKHLRISGSNLATNKDEIYKFDYIDEGTIPPRNTPKRDYWGYYNGSNATNLLTGDHKPNPQHAQNGSLRMITYPTGGYSLIDYEGNYKIEEQCLQEASLPTSSPASDWQTGGVGGALLTEPYEFVVPFGQNVTFKLHQEYYPNPTPNVNGFNQGKAYFSVAGPINHTFPQPAFDNGSREFEIYLPAGTYYFNLAVRSPIYRAMYRINFCSAKGPVNVYFGGIKVKSVKSYSEGHDLASHKTYTYDGADFASPQRFNTKFEINYGSGCVIETYARYMPYCMQVVESSTGPLNSNMAAATSFYSIVTENFMKGNDVDYSIRHTFASSPFKSSPIALFNTVIPDNIQNEHFGSPYEVKTEYYKKLSSGLSVIDRVVEKEYFNSTNNLPSVASFVRQIKSLIPQPFHTMNLPANYCLENYFEFDVYYPQWFRLAQYRYIRYWQQLVSQKSTEYMYSDSGGLVGTVENLNKFYYDNPAHRQVSRIENIISKNTADQNTEEVYETTRYLYPDDVMHYQSMAGGDLTSSNLEGVMLLNRFNAHRTGTAVQVEKKDRYGNLLNASRVLYKKFTGPGLVGDVGLPEKTQSMKGGAGVESQMIDQQLFSQYNLINYRPQQITGRNGVHPSAYIFGYHSRYPIAVIKNSGFTPAVSSIADQFYNSPDYDISQFDSLASQLSGLPNVQFSIFKYLPLVGVSQIRDSKGDISNFTYDSMGRLLEVRDKDRNILQENEYHYKLAN